MILALIIILFALLIAICGAIFVVVVHNAINADIDINIEEWEQNNNDLI